MPVLAQGFEPDLGEEDVGVRHGQVVKGVPRGQILLVQQRVDEMSGGAVVQEDATIGRGVDEEVAVGAPRQKALLRVRVTFDLRNKYVF